MELNRFARLPQPPLLICYAQKIGAKKPFADFCLQFSPGFFCWFKIAPQKLRKKELELMFDFLFIDLFSCFIFKRI